ncbi:hypothetical protein GDO86_007303 [Hymenochirus boettgeri]|uniref:Uncharacterized protein n=1 Tax=Hymenochirus boettgeri TaxID=247094 RepID=A0A8T2J195_9PIPI|nr:hypothetical protein GDO86_007303 [Hymenochirus boettgeri]
MARWRVKWPDDKIVWSQIVPTRAWRGARSAVAVNNIRKNVNRAMAKYAASSGIAVVKHDDITYGCTERTVYLSDTGIDIFNLNF